MLGHIYAGLLGAEAVACYFRSVNDAKVKLLAIQQQIQDAMSHLADLIGKWKEIKASVQRVERKLGYMK